MKFGETFMEYLQAEEGLDKFSPHVEYKRLKKVLKSCRACRAALKESNSNGGQQEDHENEGSEICRLESCQCMFFFFDFVFNFGILDLGIFLFFLIYCLNLILCK